MRFLTNYGGDHLRDLMRTHPCVAEAMQDKEIGEPRATQKYSVEELHGMGLVGIYGAPNWAASGTPAQLLFGGLFRLSG